MRENDFFDQEHKYKNPAYIRYQLTRSVVLGAEGIKSDLKDALLEWHEHILDPEYVTNNGYRQFLPADHYFHGIWEAGDLVASISNKALKERREVWGTERIKIEKAFLDASNYSGNETFSDEQREQLKLISKGVTVLIGLHRKYKALSHPDAAIPAAYLDSEFSRRKVK